MARTSRRPPQPPPAAVRAIRYLETSTILAAVLEGDAEAEASIREIGTRVTSVITFAEAHRTIVRARVTNQLSDADARTATAALRALERRVGIVNLSDVVLDRIRRPFLAEPVRALDGIHLATVEMLADDPDSLTVLTRDRRIRANARAAGYAVE